MDTASRSYERDLNKVSRATSDLSIEKKEYLFEEHLWMHYSTAVATIESLPVQRICCISCHDEIQYFLRLHSIIERGER